MAQNYQYQQIPQRDPELGSKNQNYSPNPAHNVEYVNAPRNPVQTTNMPYVPPETHQDMPPPQSQYSADTGANPNHYPQNPQGQPQGPGFQQNVQAVYNQTRDAVQALPENAHVKGTQKKVCNPALAALEKCIMNAPPSRTENLIFRYELSLNDYELNNYAPYKANGVSFDDIMNVMSDLRHVENFNASEIKPNKTVVWVSSIAILAMVIASIIVSWYVPWIFAIILVWNAIAKQRKDVMDMMDQRHKDIEKKLEQYNNEYFRSFGLSWKAGDMAAWLELAVSKTSLNF